MKISKQKLLLVKEQYRLGQIKLLELQEVEKALQETEIDLIEYSFKVKQAEFDLYSLTGVVGK